MFVEEVKNTTNQNEKVIGEYLLTRDDINKDKPNKTLSGCLSYIISEARKKAQNGCCMMTDQEVFGLAVHYYDENDLEFEETKEEVVIKTSEEKQREHDEEIMEMRNKALNSSKEETPKPKKKKTNDIVDGQLSLF